MEVCLEGEIRRRDERDSSSPRRRIATRTARSDPSRKPLHSSSGGPSSSDAWYSEKSPRNGGGRVRGCAEESKCQETRDAVSFARVGRTDRRRRRCARGDGRRESRGSRRGQGCQNRWAFPLSYSDGRKPILTLVNLGPGGLLPAGPALPSVSLTSVFLTSSLVRSGNFPEKIFLSTWW